MSKLFDNGGIIGKTKNYFDNSQTRLSTTPSEAWGIERYESYIATQNIGTTTNMPSNAPSFGYRIRSYSPNTAAGSSPEDTYVLVQHHPDFKPDTTVAQEHGFVEVWRSTHASGAGKFQYLKTVTARQVLDADSNFGSSTYTTQKLELRLLDMNQHYALISVFADNLGITDSFGDRCVWLWAYRESTLQLHYKILDEYNSVASPVPLHRFGYAGAINDNNEFVVSDPERLHTNGQVGSVLYGDLGSSWVYTPGAATQRLDNETVGAGDLHVCKSFLSPYTYNTNFGNTVDINNDGIVLVGIPGFHGGRTATKDIGEVIMIDARAKKASMTSSGVQDIDSNSSLINYIKPTLDYRSDPVDGKYGTTFTDLNGIRYPSDVADLTYLGFGHTVKYLDRRSKSPEFIVGAPMDILAPGYAQLYRTNSKLNINDENYAIRYCTILNPIIDGQPYVVSDNATQYGNWEDKFFGTRIEVDDEYLYMPSCRSAIRLDRDNVALNAGSVYLYKLSDLRRGASIPHDMLTSHDHAESQPYDSSRTQFGYEINALKMVLDGDPYRTHKRGLLVASDPTSSKGNIHHFYDNDNQTRKNNSGIWSIGSISPKDTKSPYIDNIVVDDAPNEGSGGSGFPQAISCDFHNLTVGKTYYYHWINIGPGAIGTPYQSDYVQGGGNYTRSFVASAESLTRSAYVLVSDDGTTEGTETISNCKVIISGSPNIDEEHEWIGVVGPFTTQIQDTSRVVSYTPQLNASYNENVQWTPTVETYNDDGTGLYWSIDSTSGSTRSAKPTADFNENGGTIVVEGELKQSSSTVSGADTIYTLIARTIGDTGNAIVESIADSTTEGTETFYFKVWDGLPSVGASGTLLAEQAFDILDTSTAVNNLSGPTSFNEDGTIYSIELQSSVQSTKYLHIEAVNGSSFTAADLDAGYTTTRTMTYLGTTGSNPTLYRYGSGYAFNADATTEGDEDVIYWASDVNPATFSNDALDFITATIVDTSTTPAATGTLYDLGQATASGNYTETTYTYYTRTTQAQNQGFQSGDTVRLVFRYIVGSSFTGDIQLDDINIGSKYYNLTSTTTSGNALGYANMQTTTTTTDAGYSNSTWSSLAAGTTASRWNRDTGGTPSSNTGTTVDSTGSTTGGYVYAETSSLTYTNTNVMYLRTEEIVWDGGTISFRMCRNGATIGTLQVYMEDVNGAIAARAAAGTNYGSWTSIGYSGAAVDSDTYMGSTADYDGPYAVWTSNNVSNVGVNKRVYLGHKVTTSSTFYSDLPIAGVQHLNSSNQIVNSWIFYGSTGGSGSTWETATTSSPGPTTGFNMASTGYSWASMGSAGNINYFSFASSTGSSNTGAAGGISTNYITTRFDTYPPGSNASRTSGNTPTQVQTNYYMFRETSGTTLNNQVQARSPQITISSGDYFKVCFIITHPSTDRQDVNDCIFFRIV